MSDNARTWEPLPRAEVIKAVDRQRPSRIPLIWAKWWGEGLVDQYGERLRELDRFPDDHVQLFIDPVNIGAMNLSWEVISGGGHDSNCVIDDWAKLDEFVEKLPDPEKDPAFDELIERAKTAHERDIYLLFGWWNLFFEKPWNLRGMENLMVDYYTEKENIHKMHDALADQYLRYLTRAVRDIKPDGFWSSDDLGHQTQLMMSPATFRELIKPYYVKVGKGLESIGLRHWWLHSCGNNTEIMGDLAEAGVTVFHPVQKGTMDEVAIAREFGDKLSFLAGLDVQHVLQEESPERVREEVRFIIDTFDRPEGGLCIAAGNGIVSGTPFENIEAFLDETLIYGEEHRKKM